jgi:hypothetical protein
MAGESLRAVCKHLPVTEAAVRQWVVEDEAFASQYARARSIGYDCRAEKAVEDAKEVEDPQKARLAFDAERWFLGKMKPKVYGDKIDLTTGGEPIKMDETAIAVRAAALIEKGLSRADAEPE